MTLHLHMPAKALEDRLEAAIPALMAQAHVPGLSIALVRDATLVWSRAFGLKKAHSATPVTIDTIFQAASLSKPVFAYAVLQMVERGEIDLNAPLTRCLPAPYVPDDPLLDQITARMVLCHTTGWPNWRPTGQPLARERAPGNGFGYSGEGYIYLQRVIEHVSGQPLDVFMKHAVLDPLRMRHSSYVWAAPDDPAVAASHDRTGQPCTPFTALHPETASSLHTTAPDLACFLCALLAPIGEPGQLRPVVAEMLQPQVRLDHGVSWSLGWGLEATRDGDAFWHWGDNPGFKSFVLAFPLARMGVVIMTNGDNGLALWEPIVRLAMGGDHPAFAWLAHFYGMATLATG